MCLLSVVIFTKSSKKRGLLTLETATTFYELIKYVETSFGFTPDYDPTFLQKIPVDVGASNAPIQRETNSYEFAKSAGIIIPLCLSISKRFQNGIRLEDLSLQ